MNYITKYLVRHVITALIAAIVTACSTDTEEIRSGSSLLIPSVSVNATIIMPDGTESSTLIKDIPTEADMSLRVSSADGLYTASWPSMSQYPMSEPYRPGAYKIEAFSGPAGGEGFDSPYFYGSTDVAMYSGQTTTADIECHVTNTAIRVDFPSDISTLFTSAKAIVHSTGGNYFDFTDRNNKILYIKPGDVSIYLDITTVDGKSAEFLAYKLTNTLPGTLHDIHINASTNDSGNIEFRISADMQSESDFTSIELSTDFFNDTAPKINPVGFTNQVPYSIYEGDSPSEPISFTIDSENISALVLTTISPSLTAKGWPEEVNLLTVQSSTLAAMESLGLRLLYQGESVSTIDLTNVIKHLRANDGDASISIMAIGKNGKTTGPVQLLLNVMPVDLSVISVSDIMMGINTAQATLLCPSGDIEGNISIEIKNPSDGRWDCADILSVEPYNGSQSGEWNVRFHVPDMTSPKAEIRILYCGEEKARQVINFVSPEFSLEVDAYAQLAAVRIISNQTDLIPTITSLANIYVNSQPTILVSRNIDKGIIIVGGLTEHTLYDIKATLYDNISAEGHFTNSVRFETEQAVGVPNGSFEDVDDGISYKNLPSGGRYSQNIVDIFNQQNYASYDQFIPKGWANVNQKTFCTAATNRNTWYMQPSTYSIMDCTEGAYAVCLQTTAWDINGPAIPNYRQIGMPYTDYSKNIPEIANRASGKIFLGEYYFNPVTMDEQYVEGIPFSSRPHSLNGQYRYIPCVSDQKDCALINIEILGNVNGSEIVISRASKRLPAATGYTAFSIPLEYDDFGVKATRLKLMISSSAEIGSIEEESVNISTYSNPQTSTSLGSTLWIDNLTFSY